MLCKVAALRTFSLDKLQYWRESSSGISSLAHFVSKDTIDHFNTVIKPAVYLSMFYFFSNPRSSFADNYIVLLCLVYCVTGIGYALAIFLEPGPSQLVSTDSLLKYLKYYSSVFIFIFFYPTQSTTYFPLCVVCCTASCCFDSCCNTHWKWQILEDDFRCVLPKMGAGGICYCKRRKVPAMPSSMR